AGRAGRGRMAVREKSRDPCGSRLSIGGGGRNRTAVRRHSMPGTTCLARCSISSHGNTTCEAHRDPHPLWIRNRLTGRRRDLSLDDDPTSTSKGTSGFGAYALSGESVDVVV